MNIMLVSVTERTREIGIRKAVGAEPRTIRRQFLAEATMLSLLGGLIGVVLGVGGAGAADRLAGLRTVISPTSIVIAVAVSVSVGLFFGYYPARHAAGLDPLEALRHE
jgi:putative ABC transport system permease protein